MNATVVTSSRQAFRLSFPRKRENEAVGRRFEERPSITFKRQMDSRFRGNDNISDSGLDYFLNTERPTILRGYPFAISLKL